MGDSVDLVPGDLVDLSENNLTTFPADLLLLSGDAIVNESMLTGESVPVSKVPIEPDVVSLVSAPGGEISADLSRHVVYNGTKVIRIRKTAPTAQQAGVGGGDVEAVAMVMRTGFNTTKGALVRSMLFPKPFGCAILLPPLLMRSDSLRLQLRLLPRFFPLHRCPCRCSRLRFHRQFLQLRQARHFLVRHHHSRPRPHHHRRSSCSSRHDGYRNFLRHLPPTQERHLLHLANEGQHRWQGQHRLLRQDRHPH
jgi:magnesium-transporting ATPase (P-type)